MDAGQGIGVLDLYNWLPPYGETRVKMHSEGLSYIVEIEFDSENACSGSDLKIKLIFESVCSFYKAASPGANVKNIEYGKPADDSSLGTLMEYPNSKVALAWQRHFGGHQEVKHYKIVFLSANVVIEILAKGVIMEGPFTNKPN